MPLTLRYAARSDVGLVRDGNEDSGYAGPSLLILADGMGGHAAGEVASQAAVDEIRNAELPASGDAHEAINALVVALNSANDRIRQLAVEDTTREGMGTTATVLYWTGQSLAVAHIGDSRAYLVHDGQLQQITHDHTYVQSLVDEGRISREEARIHPAKSLVLKVLQGQPDVEPDYGTVDLVAGDMLLACSDGLSDVLTDDAIETVMTESADLDVAADELIRQALANGAPDNVTLLIGMIVEVDAAPNPDDTIEAYLVGAASQGDPAAPERVQRRGPSAAIRDFLGNDEREPDDPETARYAPRPPRRFRWLRPVVIVIVIGLVGWVGLRLANDWVRDQYYVGNYDGDVAIYQGVSQELGPIRLSELHEVADGLPVSALPPLYREQVGDAISAEDLDDALGKVDDLRNHACAANPPDPAPTQEPPATPASTARAGVSATAGTLLTTATGPNVTPTTTPEPGQNPDDETDPPAGEEWTSEFPGLNCPGQS